MGVINLAHGELVTVGAYVLVLTTRADLPYWLALLLALPVGAIIGAAIERGLVRRLYRRPLDTIIATFGLSLVLQQAVQFLFGPLPQPTASPFAGAVDAFGVHYPGNRLFEIAAGFVVIAAVIYIFLRTDFGLTLRAVLQNRDMASALGINVDRLNLAAFAIGSALASLAGVLIAPLVNVFPMMGAQYLAAAFFAVIVGGPGSVAGVIGGSAFMGGLLTGVGTISSQTFAQAFVIAIAAVIMRIRPAGIFKGNE
jgi:urea transport system permease protein